MATLADIRKQYPQYNDLSDADLADALYQTHYADMPRGEFDKAVGIKADQGLGFVKGVTTVGKNANDFMFKVNPLMAASDFAARAVGAPGPEQVIDSSLEQLRRAMSQVQGKRPGKIGEEVGKVAATVPTWFTPVGPLAQGAAQGYLTSDADTAQGKVIDTALGAAGNKLASGALDKLGEVLARTMSPEVRMLASQGVSLTPGMVNGTKAMAKEDKMMSRPLVGDAIAAARRNTRDTWNVATVNRAIAPLGLKVPAGTEPGFDSVAFAQDAVKKAYDAVVPRLSVVPDQAFATDLAAAKGAASMLPQELDAQFGKILRNLGVEDANQAPMALAGDALKKAHGELGRLGKTFSQSVDPNQRELGQALKGARMALGDLMERQAGDLTPALKATNKAYRGLSVVEDAASRADNGVINTGQLKQAVRRGATKKQAATGTGFMQDWSNAARNVIPAVTPDSGTAARVMAGNPAATVMALPALAGFKTGQALTQQLLKANPQMLKLVQDALLKLRGPAGTIGGYLPSTVSQMRK